MQHLGIDLCNKSGCVFGLLSKLKVSLLYFEFSFITPIHQTAFSFSVCVARLNDWGSLQRHIGRPTTSIHQHQAFQHCCRKSIKQQQNSTLLQLDSYGDKNTTSLLPLDVQSGIVMQNIIIFRDLTTLAVIGVHFVCLFVFVALQPIVVVLSQPGSGLQLLHFRGFLITHNDATQSVGLLWTSDQSVAETST